MISANFIKLLIRTNTTREWIFIFFENLNRNYREIESEEITSLEYGVYDQIYNWTRRLVNVRSHMMFRPEHNYIFD